MIRVLTAALLAAFFVFGCAAPTGNQYAARERATVFVKAGDGHGSGVLLGADAVVTAAHVVRGMENIEVVFSDGRRVGATTIWRGEPETFDVALLRLEKPVSDATARLSCATLYPDQQLQAFGAPVGGRWISTTLRVASSRHWGGAPQHTVTVQGPIAPGMSGGPVFDAEGNVVGLLQAQMMQPLASLGMFGQLGAPMGIGGVFPSSAICDALPVDMAARE